MDVALETSWIVKQALKYNVILKIAVFRLKHCFLLIFSPNPHLIIYINKVKLGKTLGSIKPIKRLVNYSKRYRFLIIRLFGSGYLTYKWRQPSGF